MTNYQVQPCPQCKGLGIIKVKSVDWSKVKWYHGLNLCSPHPKKTEIERCGYCETKGFVAVDVDKLVKI